MAKELVPKTIEQFTDGGASQPQNDWLLIRREDPVGSGKYQWLKVRSEEVSTGSFGYTAVTRAFSGGALAAGTYNLLGGYIAPAAHKAFTNASATQTLGTANVMYGMHAFVVVSGVGSTDAGTVELEVSGTSVDDSGNRTPADTEVLIADITAASVVTDAYFQTSKKWLGQVTFTLQGASGSPTTFSLTANYGFAAYEAGGGNGFVFDSIDLQGHCQQTDSTGNFDMVVWRHPFDGDTTMTYSAAAFSPGGEELFRMSDVVTSTDADLVATNSFHFKRSGINTSVAKTSSQGTGMVVQVITGTTDAIEYMNVTVGIK